MCAIPKYAPSYRKVVDYVIEKQCIIHATLYSQNIMQKWEF